MPDRPNRPGSSAPSPAFRRGILVNDADLGTWRRWFKERGAERLRQLLMQVWDPIGVHVQGEPVAQDEYDDYLEPIANRLRTSPSSQPVAELLSRFRTKTMGLHANPDADERVANLLVAWYDDEMRQLAADVRDG